MSDGQWTQIILGSISSNDLGKTWLAIRRGVYGADQPVPDAGVVVEIAIKAHPAHDIDTPLRRFRVMRNGVIVQVVEDG